MKKICVVLFFIAASLASYSQSIWTVGISGGLDSYKNKYYSRNDAVKFEDGNLDFHAGLDFGIRITKTVRFRINCNYGEYSFGQKPYGHTVYAKSEKTLSHLDVIPRVDVRLVSYRKFDLLISPGYDLEYILESKNSTTLPNGDKSKRVYVDPNYNSKYSGPTLGAIARYKIDKHFAITLSPDYTYFLDKLYNKNDNNLQRFRVGLGFEWNI